MSSPKVLHFPQAINGGQSWITELLSGEVGKGVWGMFNTSLVLDVATKNPL